MLVRNTAAGDSRATTISLVVRTDLDTHQRIFCRTGVRPRSHGVFHRMDINKAFVGDAVAVVVQPVTHFAGRKARRGGSVRCILLRKNSSQVAVSAVVEFLPDNDELSIGRAPAWA